MVSADYYDGRTAKRHDVTLNVEGEMLRLAGDGVDRLASLHELRLSEPMGAAPRLITFADGAFCEVRDHAGLAWLLEQTGHRDNLVVRWQYSLRWVLAALVLFVALAAAGYRYGVPWLAQQLAERVPAAVARDIGEQALKQLDDGLAEPSRLAAARREEIVARFGRLAPPAGKPVPHRIVFRRSQAFGANALALPSGTLIVFDDLVALAHSDEEILGVLAHELGHVRARHGLRLMLQGSIVGLVSAWYIGDVSSALAAAPVLLLQASYSREFEREADAYAIDMLRANAIAPAHLADLLERLENARERRRTGREAAATMPDYLSTHPATGERLRLLRERNP